VLNENRTASVFGERQGERPSWGPWGYDRGQGDGRGGLQFNPESQFEMMKNIWSLLNPLFGGGFLQFDDQNNQNPFFGNSNLSQQEILTN
jgi:hypothetical protein